MSEQAVEPNGAEAPDYSAMSEVERIAAAGEAIAAEELDDADGSVDVAKPAEGSVSSDGAGEPEAEESAEGAPPEEDDKRELVEAERTELQELRQLRREKDSAFAQLRRQDHQLRAARAENERRAAELDTREKRLADGERLEQLSRENPHLWFEESAKRLGLTPSEYIDRIQRRYLNQGAPGPEEQVSEVRAVKTEIQQLREELKREKEELRSQRESRELETVKAQQAETLGRALDTGATKWRLLAKLRQTNPEEFKTIARRAVDDLHSTGESYTAGELLDFLEQSERQWYESRGRHYGEQGSVTPGDEQKTVSGTGPQARARKPAAAQRTVNNHDAANSSGARRELTEEERLMEADKVLREGGFV